MADRTEQKPPNETDLLKGSGSTETAPQPFGSCLCIDLRAAAQTLTSIYDEALAPSGITVTQFSQLNLVRILAGPTLKAMAEASQLDRSTLGRNVRVLERLDLIEMKIGSDARTRTIHLTNKGRQAFRRAAPLWVDVQTKLLDRINDVGRDQLDRLLDTLTQPLSTPA